MATGGQGSGAAKRPLTAAAGALTSTTSCRACGGVATTSLPRVCRISPLLGLIHPGADAWELFGEQLPNGPRWVTASEALERWPIPPRNGSLRWLEDNWRATGGKLGNGKVACAESAHPAA
ncbi:hypothetical protein GCM10027451_49200 [Geodermatophilus aquaeductus]